MKMKMKLMSAVAIVFASLVANCAANAETAPLCYDSHLIGPKLISDICWTCMLPIKVAGIPISTGSSTPPLRAATDTLCICQDKNDLPQVGLALSMWMPARISEVVRHPGCSPSLGGIVLPISDWRNRGSNEDEVTSSESGNMPFHQFHWFAFPLLQMLDLFVSGRCSDGYLDFDLIYMMELDPTWNNDELAFFTHPESAVVANPAAQLACVADVAASAAGQPIDAMFWCAGGWSNVYPVAGHGWGTGSLAENTSQITARGIAALHRRGMSWRSMGNDALCGPVIDPMLPKSMYRFSMFSPMAEANSNHAFGAPSLLWGDFRQIPGVGEDATYVTFRWSDCCGTSLLGGK